MNNITKLWIQEACLIVPWWTYIFVMDVQSLRFFPKLADLQPNRDWNRSGSIVVLYHWEYYHSKWIGLQLWSYLHFKCDGRTNAWWTYTNNAKCSILNFLRVNACDGPCLLWVFRNRPFSGSNTIICQTLYHLEPCSHSSHL